MKIERRNTTSLGRKRRRDYDRSVKRLRGLGMPTWAVEYYSRLARVAGLPPHMVVCHVAVVVAGRQMAGKPANQTTSSKLAILQVARRNAEPAGPRTRRRNGLAAKRLRVVQRPRVQPA
jgi:hypothetical protein